MAINVRPAATAPEMWRAFESGPVDLVLLDIMLPGTSGIDLCRELRRTSEVPIIFISAKGSETDRVVGLELGADDYLAKPFGTREIDRAHPRGAAPSFGRARPRRSRDTGDQASTAGRSICRAANCCRRPAPSVELTGAEFDLLVACCDHAQRVIARERLIELSRTRLGDSSDRSIDVLISRLRRKLSGAGKEAPIVTVRGVGYMLNARSSGDERCLPHSFGLIGRAGRDPAADGAGRIRRQHVPVRARQPISVREDEAHRLAEHLVIASKLIEEAATGSAPAMAPN